MNVHKIRTGEIAILSVLFFLVVPAAAFADDPSLDGPSASNDFIPTILVSFLLTPPRMRSLWITGTRTSARFPIIG